MGNLDEKEFDLAIILTITTYRMFVPQEEVAKAINYITGEHVFTHSFCSICSRIQPYIFKRYPELKGVGEDYEGVGWDGVNKFINEMKEIYGPTRKLGKLTKQDGYIALDPIQELENLGFKYESETTVDGKQYISMKREEDPLEGEELEIVKRGR